MKRFGTALVRHLDLFSGIGGFALAARWVGWETVAFCEIDPYCQKVLAKHWPGVPIHTDVTELDGSTYRGAVDIITGGFPCQDISIAGKQAGIDGERSGLWSDLARIIGEVRPRFAVVENVPMLLSGERGGWFQRVLGDLAEIGLDAEWHCIPASAIGAPHQRDRVWIIAHPNNERRGEAESLADADRQSVKFGPNEGCGERKSEASPAGALHAGNESTRNKLADADLGLRDGVYWGREPYKRPAERSWWELEPDVGRVANGIPRRVDRLRSLGNAIVPQVAERIFMAIDAIEKGHPNE